MTVLIALAGGFLLDLLFGDPDWLPHPVVLMGRYITWFEKRLRPKFPGTPKGELAGGVVLALSLPLITLCLTGGVCLLARRVHPWAEIALQTFWCFQSLAARGLAAESRRVYTALAQGDLPAARRAVARIVGRDTERLDAQGVTRAAVETVAENASDGVIAPLFYMALGGAPLALTYKAVNTLDSMVGYKNDRYLWFGRASARLDDGANYLPARFSALMLVLAAAFLGLDWQEAFRTWRRDGRKHLSPNAGQTEAACAGALGIRLGGDAWYFGVRTRKAVLGEARRPCEPEDILRANRLMVLASCLFLLICLCLRGVI